MGRLGEYGAVSGGSDAIASTPPGGLRRVPGLVSGISPDTRPRAIEASLCATTPRDDDDDDDEDDEPHELWETGSPPGGSNKQTFTENP